MFEGQFPILRRKINGKRLVYLDNASTTQKPESVIRTVSDYYKTANANAHRGLYDISELVAKKLERTRQIIKGYINARHSKEVVFTRGATESINLVAEAWGGKNIKRGDEILITEMEHHSNLIPWQMLAKKKRAKLKFIPLASARTPEHGKMLDLSALNKLLTKKTRLVALTHVSNVLGIINPLKQIIKAAHKKNIPVFVDGAQAGSHVSIDVSKLDCDFYALAGHKMYGPCGVGILYAKAKLLEKMPPYQFGGGMIKAVDLRHTEFADPPGRFEAGTLSAADIIGLGSAVKFINSIGIRRIIAHETKITDYALQKLQNINDITIYGPRKRAPVIAFNVKGIPSHDLASILNERGVAIRAGHHCAMPLHKTLGICSSCRISIAVYNTQNDIDTLIKGIKDAQKLFRAK